MRVQVLLPALGRRSSAGRRDSMLLVCASYRRWCITPGLQVAAGRRESNSLEKVLRSVSQWTRRCHSKAWHLGAVPCISVSDMREVRIRCSSSEQIID